MAADEGDGDAEEERLDQAHADVPHADIAFAVLPVDMGLDAVEAGADEGAPHDAHEVGHDRQQRNEQAQASSRGTTR